MRPENVIVAHSFHMVRERERVEESEEKSTLSAYFHFVFAFVSLFILP